MWCWITGPTDDFCGSVCDVHDIQLSLSYMTICKTKTHKIIKKKLNW